MPTFFCLRCGKETPVYPKRVPTVPSGPLIAGHLMNNPNLPIVGVRLGSSERLAFFCRACGEEVRQIPNESEKQEHLKKYEEQKGFEDLGVLGLILLVICVLIIIVAIVSS